jgi:hypothetical protein
MSQLNSNTGGDPRTSNNGFSQYLPGAGISDIGIPQSVYVGGSNIGSNNTASAYLPVIGIIVVAALAIWFLFKR